jgi:predicted methyltransferase
MKLFLIAAVATATVATVAIASPFHISAPVAAAVAAPDRAGEAPTDARRHPAEVLSFSGVKPGDTVAELIPGRGYFTRIISKAVGPRGRVYVVWPDEYAKLAHPDPENSLTLSRTPGYRNITVLTQPARAFATPKPVDLVFTAQNYHDYPDKFMGKVDPAIFDRAVFRALRPGGIFLVVDHVAAAGSGMRDTDTLHRIDPAIVKAQVAAAGFKFVGSIDVLRNPADDHTKAVFHPAVRGHTDQFVMKFRKP